VLEESDVWSRLGALDPVWAELFPFEQTRIVQLLVERVDIQQDTLEVRIRAEGLVSLVGELRQDAKRKAA
jgi:site-specific DNA recombinase